MAANLKEVRERITSVNSTQQITKAMKMVSAAKLKRSQDAITQLRPYSNRLYMMLSNIMKSLKDQQLDIPFNDVRDIERVLVIVVTSSKGLCGAFNTNIAKAAKNLITTKYQKQYENGDVMIALIGKKGYDALKRELPKAKLKTDDINSNNDTSFDKTTSVANEYLDLYTNNKFDAIDVVYGQFINAASQEAKVESFLPVASLPSVDDKRNIDFIFQPNKEEMLKELIPSILRIQFQKYILDTSASEHGARMTAMDKATENANELLKDLKIKYNKARQEAITNEISEIVGGAAALEG